MKKTTHKVEVVPLVLEKHPNADKLSLARFDDYTCVVNTEQWAGHDKAAYLQPDTLVPENHPSISFLFGTGKDGKVRIKGKKIRGIISFGLLVPAPPGAEIGDDVADFFQAERYEPPAPALLKIKDKSGNTFDISEAELTSSPQIFVPKYDLEPGLKYATKVFSPGEKVLVTLKIHGENCRIVHYDNQLYVGSRTQWKREFADYSHITKEYLLEKGVQEENVEEILNRLSRKGEKERFWRGLDNTPGLRELVEKYPKHVFFGESYGEVGGFPYDCEPKKRKMRLFDILKPDGEWMEQEQARDICGNLWVPVLGDGIPFDLEQIKEMAEGKDPLNPSHVREGVVVQPWNERKHDIIGRIKLKFVGLGYLEAK